MSITARCPKCDTPHTLPDRRAGTAVRCNGCGRSFRAQVEVVETPTRRQASRSTVWILVGVIAALVLVVGILFLVSRLGATEKPLPKTNFKMVAPPITPFQHVNDTNPRPKRTTLCRASTPS